MWPETVAGRQANEIISGVVLMVERILSTYPDFTEIITWSDSCVPQKQNSIMIFAIEEVFRNYPRLLKETMKHCDPGHLRIQEIHTVNSYTERSLKYHGVHPTLNLVKHLKQT